jgi:hypothetical protein
VHSKREDIANALINRFQTLLQPAGPFVTVSRRGKIWSAVPSDQQPAFFLIHPGGRAEQPAMPGKPTWVLTRWTINYMAIVYARADADPNVLPDSLANFLFDAVEAAIKPAPLESDGVKLGGLVENAWIEGDYFVDTGIEDQQIAIMIPIHVLTGI